MRSSCFTWGICVGLAMSRVRESRVFPNAGSGMTARENRLPICLRERLESSQCWM